MMNILSMQLAPFPVTPIGSADMLSKKKEKSIIATERVICTTRSRSLPWS